MTELTTNEKRGFKPINFKLRAWKEIDALATEVGAERGGDRIALPKMVMEAIEFYKQARNAPNPGE